MDAEEDKKDAEPDARRSTGVRPNAIRQEETEQEQDKHLYSLGFIFYKTIKILQERIHSVPLCGISN